MLQTGSAGPGWRKPTATSSAPASCSTEAEQLAPGQSERPAVARRALRPHPLLQRRRWRSSTASRRQNRDGTLGPNELLEKGRLLDRIGPLRRGLCRVRRGQAAVPRGERPGLHGRARAAAGRPAQGLLHRDPARDPAAGAAARGHRAADLHPRLPALGHDPGRADPVGASAHLGRRRTAVRQRDHRAR